MDTQVKITITLYCDDELRIEDQKALLETVEKDLKFTLEDAGHCGSPIYGFMESQVVVVNE